MLLVHYLEDSRAHRILWLLEELGGGDRIGPGDWRRRPRCRVYARNVVSVYADFT